MTTAGDLSPTKLAGITYNYPRPGALLTARDGKVAIPLEGLPLPLLDEDLSGNEPSYDAVGRGIYHLLRANPDACRADRYAVLLRDAYPHLLAELATHLVMLDKKDVDLPYIDRKIVCLKIFALLEPDNIRFPYEIGAAYAEKGMTLAALGNTTLHLFAAEKFLRKALLLCHDDVRTRYLLGEICYLLGKYQEAAGFWTSVVDGLPSETAARVTRKVALVAAGSVPVVPPVDYLQAVGVALEAYEGGDYEEAAAIILDVLDDVAELEEFPQAEINYLLGLCYTKLDIPRYAEQYFRAALQLRPDYAEALHELQQLGVES